MRPVEFHRFNDAAQRHVSVSAITVFTVTRYQISRQFCLCNRQQPQQTYRPIRLLVRPGKAPPRPDRPARLVQGARRSSRSARTPCRAASRRPRRDSIADLKHALHVRRYRSPNSRSDSTTYRAPEISDTVWLGSAVVRALDVQSTGHGFDSRTPHCRL